MKALCLAVSVFLGFGVFVSADDYVWYGAPGSGVFGNPNNWNINGVPSTSDRVFFGFLNFPYTVTLDDFYQNAAMYVDGADMTLNLNGNVYNATGDYGDERAVFIGRDDLGESTSLTINNGGAGGWLYSREVSIGYSQGAVGSLTLSGADAYWTTEYLGNWHGVWLGELGDAALSVLDNAGFRHGHGLSAWGADSKAIIDVNGLDSEWYVDGQFDMSIFGSTAVDVSDGGLVNIGKLTMGLERNSSADITVTSVNQHESELMLRAGLETSLTIGKNGNASIRFYNSKLLNYGTMVIGENPGSSGLLELHEGTWADCPGSIAVGGSFEKAGGAGRISIIDDNPEEGAGVRFEPTRFDGQFVKVWPQGTITMDGGEFVAEYGSMLGNPIILQGGTLEGNGMIWAHVENNGGLVAPWDEENNKVLEIGYNYSQDAAGVLKIAIAGREPVSQYAHLRITQEGFGQVVLDGMLEVDLVGDFVPDYEDRFEIIAAQDITGTFSNAVSKYVFESGSFDVIYNTESFNSVILTHYSSSPSCPTYPMADFNKDCRVDLIDFAMFAGQWMQCNVEPQSACPGATPL